MVVKLVQDVQDGRRDHSVGELLRSVEPVFWQLLAGSMLFGVGVGISFVLLIIPGLILLVIWSVVAPVTVLERPDVFAAFGQSRELVRGNGWNVFGVIVIVFLAVAVISIAAGLIAAGLARWPFIGAMGGERGAGTDPCARRLGAVLRASPATAGRRSAASTTDSP
ncbi:MAG: hypothetical protein ACXVXL_06520 [Solirubrobacteraceae bacterium]